MFKNKVVWIIIAIVAILFFWVKGVYNNMVTQDEGVKTAWSQVENQYQRRMDLIPNLVNTVKDLTKVKTKVALNLTKRQLIFFSLAAVVGIPFYLVRTDSIAFPSNISNRYFLVPSDDSNFFNIL